MVVVRKVKVSKLVTAALAFTVIVKGADVEKSTT